MNRYVARLIALGFDEKTAELIDDGRNTKALTEKEFLTFAAAWENDRVEPMKPLVEEYGWDGLVERLEESVEQ